MFGPLAVLLSACAIGGVNAQCATVPVPENRALADGPQIALRVAVLPATDRAHRRDDPLFYVTGGPGGVAYDQVPGIAQAFASVNTHRDIVFVDQRGVGGSGPFSCQTATGLTDVAALVRDCLGQLTVDVTHYRTVDAADDLDAVREALGYARIDLYGISYGATFAQVFVRRHPASVRSVVLDGATLLDIPVFERWSSSGQRALDLLHRRCHADKACAKAFPRWYERFPALLAKLAKKPVQTQGVTVDAAAAAGAVHELSASTGGAAAVPYLLAKAEGGTYRPLAAAVKAVSISLPLMYLAITCTEPWAAQDPARVAADANGSYLTYSFLPSVAARTQVCGVWPKVDTSAEDWSRVRSNVPVLALVGGADPKDPPRNVAGITGAMPNAKVVVVPGGGHGVAALGCLPRVMDDFLEVGTARGLDTSCVSLTPLPAFKLH
ncbi:MAG TPA: alpha/beta fold hydrolase [Gaiellaceae bacterium]